jgi:hypothetical protein
MHPLIAAMLAAVLAGVSTAAGESPPKPSKHVDQTIEGWIVHVDERLLGGPDGDVGKRALQILGMRLADLRIAVPADKVTRLQKVPIWLDHTHGALTQAQYHTDAGWLKEHGYNVAMAKAVHIPDAAEFASAAHQRVQPWSVLHELAHAYHDQVLGFDNAEITAAWKQFKESGRYEKVLHISGRTVRHYGLTNQREFFAEMSETYFGTNDFFPFNRAELRHEEPAIYALLDRIWNAKP